MHVCDGKNKVKGLNNKTLGRGLKPRNLLKKVDQKFIMGEFL